MIQYVVQSFDPIFLLALPVYVMHSRAQARRLEQARAAAMRRHPSSRG